MTQRRGEEEEGKRDYTEAGKEKEDDYGGDRNMKRRYDEKTI